MLSKAKIQSHSLNLQPISVNKTIQLEEKINAGHIHANKTVFDQNEEKLTSGNMET